MKASHPRLRAAAAALALVSAATLVLACGQPTPSGFAASPRLSAVATSEAATNRTPASPGTELQPAPALPAILDALRRYPLVALCDRHQLQQEHDLIQSLLRSPALPGLINDIVVEFGNPLKQSISDRYLLTLEPLQIEDVRQIWRQTGSPLWDAPVYEQFFRTVRDVNAALPASRRIRVVLGDTPIDYSRVHDVADADYVRTMENETDAHFAQVVETEVMAKGHRALLIAGGGHLRLGLHADQRPRSDAPGQPPNAGTRIAQLHPGSLYVIDTLIVGYLDQPSRARALDAVGTWAAPQMAPLSGTWLGEQPGPSISYRALTPADERYDNQVDAVIYLGPDSTLRFSLPDPSIYSAGPYRDFLSSLSPVMSAVYGEPVDWLGDAVAAAKQDPRLFP
jgi:hypothetical protein